MSYEKNRPFVKVDVTGEVDRKFKDISVNAKDYGLNESATWETNMQAIQDANDYASSLGGGKVLVPSGEYLVRGVYQDSNVEFAGNNTVLKHPDGQSGDIITSRLFNTTCTTTAGSNVITMTDTSNLKLGAMVAIRAGLKSVRQSTTITTAITSTDTSVDIANATGFHSSGYGWIDNEVISWTLSGTTMTLTRGLFGTTAASHSTGAILYLGSRLYAETIKIEGSTVTLNKNVPFSLSSVDVSIGIVNPKISGIRFDGNKIAGGSFNNPIAVRWQLTRGGLTTDVSVVNGDLGGFMLTQGASSNTLNNLDIRDCGIPDIGKGAGIWLFQGCENNKINDPKIKGYCYYGVYMDDRTVIASEWDGGSDYNVINNIETDIVRNGGNSSVNITGSSHNKVNNPVFKGGYSGFLTNSNQNNTHDNSNPPAEKNIFNNVTVIDSQMPYSINTKGNTIINLETINTGIPPFDVGTKLINTGEDMGIEKFSNGYRWISDGNLVEPVRVVNHDMVLVPFEVPVQTQLKEVGLEVDNTVETGTYARVIIYKTDEENKPAGLEWDSGQNLVMDGTGIKYITFDRKLTAGKYYVGLAVRGVSNYANAPYLKSVERVETLLSSETRPTSFKKVSGYQVSGGGEGAVVSNPADQREPLSELTTVPAVYINVQ